MPTFVFTDPSGREHEVTAPEGATQAQAFNMLQRHLGGSKPAASPPQRIDPSEGMGAGEKFLVGFGSAVARTGEGLGRLYAATGLPGSDDFKPALDEAAENRKLYERNRPGGWATAGEVGADVGMSLLPMGAAAAGGAKVASMLPRALARFAPAAADIAANAGYAAATAPENRLEAAGWGAGGAAAARGLQRVAGGVVKPFIQDDATALIRRGIQPTVGQSVGGIVGKLEEKATSIPVVGDTIARARNRAIREWNEKTIEAAARPIAPGGVREMADLGMPIAGGGDEALRNLRMGLGGAFEGANVHISPIKVDVADWHQVLDRIATDPALGLSEESQKRLFHYVQNAILSRGDELTPEVARRVQSDLGKVTGRFKTSSVGEERAYGEALERVKGAFDDVLMKHTDDAGQYMLAGAKEGWRAFQPLDRAAASVGAQAQGGVYTPKHLRQAIAALDKSQHDNLTRGLVQGQAPANMSAYEDVVRLANQGRVLGDTVADSGTAGRLLAVGAGAHVLGAGPAALTAAGVGVLGSTRIAQKLLTQGIAPQTVERVLALAKQHGIPEEQLEALLPQVLRALGQQQMPRPVHDTVSTQLSRAAAAQQGVR